VNAELCKKALEKVGNPNTLINLVSRRVRQLTAGSGSLSRPLVANVQNLGAGDIALMEIIQEKMGWELPDAPEPLKPPVRRRKRPAQPSPTPLPSMGV
jgi:DNA-directed RNA polymerase subunit omega